MTAAARAAPRPRAGIIEALRRHRLTVGTVTVLYLLTYLWSIGDIVVTAADRSRFAAAGMQVAADWPAKLLQQTAPFSYEPVLAARLTGHILLLLAPVNVAELAGGPVAPALAWPTRPGVGITGTRRRGPAPRPGAGRRCLREPDAHPRRLVPELGPGAHVKRPVLCCF